MPELRVETPSRLTPSRTVTNAAKPQSAASETSSAATLVRTRELRELITPAKRRPEETCTGKGSVGFRRGVGRYAPEARRTLAASRSHAQPPHTPCRTCCAAWVRAPDRIETCQ